MLAAEVLAGQLVLARVTELAGPVAGLLQLIAVLLSLLVARVEAADALLPADQLAVDRLNLLLLRLALVAPHRLVVLGFDLALMVQVALEAEADLFLLVVTAGDLCLCGQVPLNKR